MHSETKIALLMKRERRRRMWIVREGREDHARGRGGMVLRRIVERIRHGRVVVGEARRSEDLAHCLVGRYGFDFRYLKLKKKEAF